MPASTDPLADFRTRRLELAKGRRATLLDLAPARDAADDAPAGTGTAVLYVHGFSDYFFQDHVARHFTDAGIPFYAIDLRGYGRSLQDGELPAYVTDLAEHHEELDRAVETMLADGVERIVLLAHSTGGLIVPLWLADRRGSRVADAVVAVVLNSPWFDLQGSDRFRRKVDLACATLGVVRPTAVINEGLGTYGDSVHNSRNGDWEFDLRWKPLMGFPVRAGWLRAVRRGQRRLHRGLGLQVPVLVLRSSRSELGLRAFAPSAMSADTVLDVEHMTRWAPSLGPDVTVEAVQDGMHDLLLSAAPVRERALAAIDEWLRPLLAGPATAPASTAPA
ncbi:alpha/beta hydrolase [Patulibacter sp.]|uniref:alpha/beta hydrolase n=1 Tax=Patulibacter sp. TaxID=1912859 RepID=UPI00271F10A0|nr:alpha/beta hydrolase [Patulibacter sp.]MDO9409364.1 alpha/beta hydrolase [Patulibacter sp.]